MMSVAGRVYRGLTCAAVRLAGWIPWEAMEQVFPKDFGVPLPGSEPQLVN